MNIAQLRSALKRLPTAIGEWSTEEATNALGALDSLLKEHDERTIVEFCSAVKVSKPKRATKPRATSQVDVQTVSSYVGQLRAASADLAAFTSVMNRMRKDKSIRVGEARAIAMEYTGTDSVKTKRDAFKEIEQRRAKDARSRVKREHLSDIF